MKSLWIVLPLILFNLLLSFAASAFGSTDKSAEILNSKYADLGAQLRNNQFKRPVFLDSVEASNQLKGDVYAVIDHPFNEVNAALQLPSNWCDILILHINTKYCKATSHVDSAELKMRVGKKVTQPIEDAYELELGFRVMQSDRNYLSVKLNANEGPMGTRNFRILLEAIPVQGNKTFIHLSYSYDFGLAGGLAMKAYLASVGRNKVGFTVISDSSDSHSHYIKGMRGMVERNTMRYYLAIDSYLNSLSVPVEARINKRMQDWFAATEQYPRQLHELSSNAYLVMKQEELKRMNPN
jgi:hypothetical protein